MKKKKLKTLITDVRIAVSCCCSEHRYREINTILDKMETVLEDKKSNRLRGSKKISST